MQKKIPLIVDCDPGIDDAFALLLLYKYKKNFDIKLFSATAGNVDIEKTSNNLSFLVENYFTGCKISKGDGVPLGKYKKENCAEVHGESGLGDFKISKQKIEVELNSVDEIIKTLEESGEKVVILTLGPLTNIAKVLIKAPHIKEKIEAIYCMIGSKNNKGNVQDCIEFNAYFDPFAFDFVVKSGCKIVINPFEVADELKILKSKLIELKKVGKTQNMVAKMVSGIYEEKNPEYISLFDPNIFYALVKPEFYNFEPCEIVVNLDEKTAGMCKIINYKNSQNLVISVKDGQVVNDSILADLENLR